MKIFFFILICTLSLSSAVLAEQVVSIDSISDVADGFVGNDPYKLDSVAKIALELAVADKNARIESISLMQIGIASAMKGDNAHALKRMNEAWIVAKGIDNKRLMVNCLTNMSGVYEMANLPEKAKEKLELATSILETTKYRQTKANTYLTLSIVQEKLGDFEGSKESVSSAMEVFHETKNVDRYFYCVEQLANLLHRNKQFDEAIKLYTFAISGWIWKDEMGKLISLHAERGKAYYFEEQYTKAKLDLGFAYSLSDSFNITHSTDSILSYQLKTAATLGENHLIAIYTDRLNKLFQMRNTSLAADKIAELQNDCLTKQHELELKLERAEASLISTQQNSSRTNWILSGLLALFIAVGVGLRLTKKRA